MIHESIIVGLNVKPFSEGSEKAEKYLEKPTTNSLSGFWWLAEFYPWRQLSYKTQEGTIRRYVYLLDVNANDSKHSTIVFIWVMDAKS